jgi:hypothetical protein
MDGARVEPGARSSIRGRMDGARVEPGDLLRALDIAARFKKDLHEARQLALALVDWAVQESDACPPAKLLKAAAAVRTIRGKR